MINFLKKHWLFIVLGTLATLLSGLWFLKPQIVEESMDVSLAKLEKADIVGVDINPETKISFGVQVERQKRPVLQMTRKQSLTLEEITTISQKLGFFEKPLVAQDITAGTVYTWNNNDGNSLTITPKTNTIEYDRDLISSPPIELGNLPDPTVAKNKLFSLFEELGISPVGFSFEQKERYFVVSDFAISEAGASQASILELVFKPFFEQIIIATNSAEAPVISASFDKLGNILNFKIQNPINKITAGEQYPLKSLENVKNSIYKEGKMLQTTLDYQGTTLEDINLASITISEINLTYFLDYKADIIQPVYIMHGLAQSPRSGSHKIQIYLPAIESQYLK